MSTLRPPTSDDQPSSAPAATATHTRQRSRSLTRDFPLLLPTAHSPAPASPGPPSSPPHSPNPLAASSSVTLKALLRQVEYYFSNQNLWKDAFLLTEMARDPQAFVPLATILSLHKVSRLSTDPAVLQSAVRLSTKLQLSDDGTKLRRIAPLPPYDQLRDAHRSLYVDHLPAGSTVKTVKRLFGVFGKVTYVLRTDHISSASPLNASPRLSPLIAPSSPSQPLSASAAMPRLSLSSTQPLTVGGALTVPSGSASDSADGVFTSAFVQFEQASSMQQAVDMIQAQQRAAKERAIAEKKTTAAVTLNGHGSPMLNRRSIVGSPALTGRALGGEQLGSTLAMLRQTQNERVPHINDIIFTPPHTIRTITPSTPNPSSASSSPAITATSSPSTSHDPLPNMDLTRPATPNTPNSPPPHTGPLDFTTPLPPVLLSLYVLSKGDYLHDQEERIERERERQVVREREQRLETRSWRSSGGLVPGVVGLVVGGEVGGAGDGGGEAKEVAAGGVGGRVDEVRDSGEVGATVAPVEEDPIIRKMKEDARMKVRQEEKERERMQEREKEYRRQHLSERVQERHAHQEQLRERDKAQLKQQELDNIIHISPRPSPRPSPVMRPLPSPILIHNNPQLGSLTQLTALSLASSASHSPSLSPSLPPTGPLSADALHKPRFSLTKRTSIAAANVASHFALGPDAPDSKGFNGRGRGKILPLAPGRRASVDNGMLYGGGGHPAVHPPPLH